MTTGSERSAGWPFLTVSDLCLLFCDGKILADAGGLFARSRCEKRFVVSPESLSHPYDRVFSPGVRASGSGGEALRAFSFGEALWRLYVMVVCVDANLKF